MGLARRPRERDVDAGARVFAGGAQQLSWPLDTFDLGRFGRTLPPDPRFQQFMRNVLGRR